MPIHPRTTQFIVVSEMGELQSISMQKIIIIIIIKRLGKSYSQIRQPLALIGQRKEQHKKSPAHKFAALSEALLHFLQIKYKEEMKDIEEMCHFLEGSSLQEAERRASKYFSSQLGTELPLLFKGTKG